MVFLFLGIKGHLPLFVPVDADVACDGIVLEPRIMFESYGVGGSGIVLELDGSGIVFEVDGDGVRGGDIVFKVDGVEGGGIVFEVNGVAVGGGLLLDGAS
ncbi:hypothetical protein Tco_1268477 [Tanacetum coccineum]